MRTYDVVVLAADGVGVAVTAAHTDDADRRAGQANQDVNALDDNPEQAQEEGSGGVACLLSMTHVNNPEGPLLEGSSLKVTHLLDGVAALDRAGGTT